MLAGGVMMKKLLAITILLGLVISACTNFSGNRFNLKYIDGNPNLEGS